MTKTFLQITAVSITALSLSACMSGQGSPWSPEFGQVQAPQHQQSTYGQTHYQYGQYPLPSVQHNTNNQYPAQPAMRKYSTGSSQHLSPLRSTYSAQPMSQSTQTPTWTGQQPYNAPYSTPAHTSNYQQQMMDYTTQTYESAPKKSYQMPYNTGMSAPMRPQTLTPNAYGNPQQTSYGHKSSAPMNSQTMNNQSMRPQTMSSPRTSYGQNMKTPVAQSSSSYVQPTPSSMRQPQTYGQPMPRTSMGMSSMGSNYTGQTPMTSTMNSPQAPGMQPHMPQSNTIPWAQAMAWMYQGQVASAEQSPNAEIKLTLLDGRTIMTQSPRLDDVKRLINDCGVMCQNMQVTPK